MEFKPRLTACWAAATLALAGCAGMVQLPPVAVQVTHQEGGAPVEGADVAAYVTVHRVTGTGHGGTDECVFVLRGRTGADGWARLPAISFQPPGSWSGDYLEGPYLHVAKAGMLPVRGSGTDLSPKVASIEAWARRPQQVKLAFLPAVTPPGTPRTAGDLRARAAMDGCDTAAQSP